MINAKHSERLSWGASLPLRAVEDLRSFLQFAIACLRHNLESTEPRISLLPLLLPLLLGVGPLPRTIHRNKTSLLDKSPSHKPYPKPESDFGTTQVRTYLFYFEEFAQNKGDRGYHEAPPTIFHNPIT
jgi:hypothetical protein